MNNLEKSLETTFYKARENANGAILQMSGDFSILCISTSMTQP